MLRTTGNGEIGAAALPASLAWPSPERLRDEDRLRWLEVGRCPACGCGRIASRRALPGAGYAFGDERIGFPASGIGVAVCAQCDLVYKTVVPQPAFLSEVFARQAGKKWMEAYDFSIDFPELRRFAGGEIADVLDVGAGNGALLEACAKAGVRGRRSALDVLAHPGLDQCLAGEFIAGFVDAATLEWSRRPYHVVTLFDVLEHLYFPRLAFRNLRALVRDGGLVFIETGNVESHWPRRYGLEEWWYVRLFEHHLFWSRTSLERLVDEHGFRVVSWEERRHKSRAAAPAIRTTRDLLKVGLYCASPVTYTGLAGMLGKEGAQPWSPFTRDHIRVCLQKV